MEILGKDQAVSPARKNQSSQIYKVSARWLEHFHHTTPIKGLTKFNRKEFKSKYQIPKKIQRIWILENRFHGVWIEMDI